MRATSSATRKRLDDVIVGPEVQAKHHVGLLSLRRHHIKIGTSSPCARTARQISKPFTFGNITSSRIRSATPLTAASSPRSFRIVASSTLAACYLFGDEGDGGRAGRHQRWTL